MKVFETAAGTKVVRLDNVRCHCYLIGSSERRVLVDTSTKAWRASVERQIERSGTQELAAIIQTHFHTDHTQNTHFFQLRYHCPVFVHPLEARGLRDGYCILPQGTNAWGRAVCATQRRFHLMERFEPCENVLTLCEGGEVPGCPQINVIETPGHTDGSITLIIDDELALVGDTMIHQFGSVYPPFADNEGTLANSWQRLLATPCRLFLPAHGSEITRKQFESEVARRLIET